jgi:dihydroorotate dehydrogenase electron transfer subunit
VSARSVQARADSADRVRAPFGRRLLTVAGIDELGSYRVLRVADPAGPAPDPGQFAMLAAAERWGAGEDERPYLPRAFSVARRRGEEAHFLLEDVGPGTKRLCELRAGDELWVLAPLGVGFASPQDGRRAILVGGGVGIAPLAILQDVLTGVSVQDRRPGELEVAWGGGGVTVLLGFRDGVRAEGAALLRDALVATDDGSVGHHGLVTDLLAAELDGDAHVVVYACGPAAMLEGVRAICAARDVPAQLALEAGMACGFGACYGCVVPKRGGGYLRVCVDGPVIDAALLERVDEHAGAPA